MVDERRQQARQSRRYRIGAHAELFAQGPKISLTEDLSELLRGDRQVLTGAHPRARLATQARRGEFLNESGQSAGMALDDRGRHVEESVAALLAHGGPAGKTTEDLSEESHGDLQS